MPTVIMTAAGVTLVVCVLLAASQRQQPPAAAHSTQADANNQTALDQVKAKLAAGDDAGAIEIALAAATGAERTELLKEIVTYQVGNGRIDDARNVIRRARIAEAARTNDESLAGGARADFTTLINIIQTNVAPDTWSESGSGPGGGDLGVDEEGANGSITPYQTGVRVDPNEVLARAEMQDDTGRLAQTSAAARRADINDDVMRTSNFRLVSLARLEREVAKRIAAGQPIDDAMRNLAGISQIQFVFAYPEDGDVVIGGPAEAWRTTNDGAAIGVVNERPVLQLDDLVVLLRTFSNSGDSFFDCLIVPRQEGLKAVKTFVEQLQGKPISSGGVDAYAAQLQRMLGEQDVVVHGVPLDSRVASVIVDADYRMKLIGIDKKDAGSAIPSVFDLLATVAQEGQPALDALRWCMSMKYDSVLHSPDRDAFEIRGSSVFCESENELVTDQGDRVQTGQADAINRQFAENFTNNYADLAQQDRVFADLQQIFDLALVAAIIQHEDLDSRVNWNRGSFAARGAYAHAKHEPVRTVDSVVNHRVYNGKDIVVQVAGGVRADLMAVLTDNAVRQESSELTGTADRGRAPELGEGRWWWDAAQE